MSALAPWITAVSPYGWVALISVVPITVVLLLATRRGKADR